jgi:segregation and condensation protein A
VRAPELDLDLDTFEGPFDLLLTLVLREELALGEVAVAEIVLAYTERLAARERLDLEGCGEFLVLVASLLELKARELFPDEDVDMSELTPEEAADELARRLEEYRRVKLAAAWLAERLESESDRYFRLGPPPLQPRPERPPPTGRAEDLAQAIRSLAQEPPQLSLAHMGLRFPPIERFLDRFRAMLRRRSAFMLDAELAGLSRLEQAAAFLALLELRKGNEVRIEQAAPFAPIRVSRPDIERSSEWRTARSA